jgi:hypothetical protein
VRAALGKPSPRRCNGITQPLLQRVQLINGLTRTKQKTDLAADDDVDRSRSFKHLINSTEALRKPGTEVVSRQGVLPAVSDLLASLALIIVARRASA